MQEVIRFQPLYQDRVWGGRALESLLGRTLPPDRPIGESWEIVDRPEAQSLIRGGTLAGLTLRSAIEQHGADLMGPTWPRSKPFPILVKWLDCRERLSLQVHPPASVADELKGEPKTENWYIAHSTLGAKLIVGLKRGVTREQFERAIRENTLEDCVHHFSVSPGDSILVRSGQVHAIDAGNLILEIQQNSDTTYRVYDWGRIGLDGKPRQLHVSQSLKSIKWDDFEPAPVRGSKTPAVIADAKEFAIRRVPLAAGKTLVVTKNQQPRILSVVEGRFRSENEVFSQGDNVVLPFAGEFVIEAVDEAVLLLTENFC